MGPPPLSEATVSDLPELPRPVRTAPVELRRRTALIGGAIGLVLLLLLVAWTLSGGPEPGRGVVLVGPQSCRVVVDGEPVPVLGGDGTHLLQLSPGRHELAVTLKSKTLLTEEIEVAEGTDTLRLEVRYDRVYGRWHLVELGKQAAGAAAGTEEEGGG